jgi:hypothetical protein
VQGHKNSGLRYFLLIAALLTSNVIAGNGDVSTVIAKPLFCGISSTPFNKSVQQHLTRDSVASRVRHVCRRGFHVRNYAFVFIEAQVELPCVAALLKGKRGPVPEGVSILNGPG